MRDKRPERPAAIEGHETREFQQGFPVKHGLNFIFIDLFILNGIMGAVHLTLIIFNPYCV